MVIDLNQQIQKSSDTQKQLIIKKLIFFSINNNNEIQYLAVCHHSCANCIIRGEDKCISCPSTRYQDRIETTFKCLCNDPHYYSDESSLECLECHFTCKTCNGLQDTNCLTCDLTYRQLRTTKCDCPYGYYDVGQLQCEKCYYTCQTCFDPQINSCITCSSISNRIVKANKCICMDGYLELQFGDQICESIILANDRYMKLRECMIFINSTRFNKTIIEKL